MTSVRKSQLNRRPWLSTILLYLGVAMMLFPFVWRILSSFKTKADVYAYPARWIPSTWSWDNYPKVFDTIPFLRYYWNSIFTSVVQTFLQVALSITAGYALTRIEFPGSGLYRRLMQSACSCPL